MVAGEAEAAGAAARLRRRRYRAYLMIAAQGLTQWVPKGSLPSLVPLIAASRGWNESQRAMLLSAFFPGCAFTSLAPARPGS